jgi:hypothetical protein
VRHASELKGSVAKNAFNDELVIIPSADMSACGWPCVTISGMAFYKNISKRKKGTCLGTRTGETGEGFGDYDDYLGSHPSTGMMGETVQRGRNTTHKDNASKMCTTLATPNSHKSKAPIPSQYNDLFI